MLWIFVQKIAHLIDREHGITLLPSISLNVVTENFQRHLCPSVSQSITLSLNSQKMAIFTENLCSLHERATHQSSESINHLWTSQGAPIGMSWPCLNFMTKGRIVKWFSPMKLWRKTSLDTQRIEVVCCPLPFHFDPFVFPHNQTEYSWGRLRKSFQLRPPVDRTALWISWENSFAYWTFCATFINVWALTHVYKNLFPSVGQSVCQVTLSLNQQNSLYFCHNLCSFRERASDKGSGSINQSINHSFNHYVYSWMVCLKFMRSGKLLEYSFKWVQSCSHLYKRVCPSVRP